MSTFVCLLVELKENINWFWINWLFDWIDIFYIGIDDLNENSGDNFLSTFKIC